MGRYSLDKDKIKVLLLEGVNPSAVDSFHRAGYNQVEYLKGALDHDELIEKIKDVHFIGIRSRTHLTDDVFDAAKKLCAVGCFCIGTNQVDLESASRHGIPVLNAIVATREHSTQTRKGAFERWQNTRDIFALAPGAAEAIEGKHILVVDDVITTGATIESAISTMLPVPGTRFSVLTLAVAHHW